MISLQQLREYHETTDGTVWVGAIDHFLKSFILNDIKSEKFKEELPSVKEECDWMFENECGDFDFMETFGLGCGDANWLDVHYNRTMNVYYDPKYPDGSPVGYDSEDVEIKRIVAHFGENEFIIEDQVIVETIRTLLT